MASSTIPGLADATAVTSAFSLVASDGLGADKEVAVDLLKEFVGSVIASVPVPAVAITPTVTNGCTAVDTIATSSNHPDITFLSFGASAKEYAQFSVVMPKNWDRGTFQAAFVWSHPSTTTDFQTRWGIQAVAIGDDDTIDVAYGTAQEVTDTGGTTNDYYFTAKVPAVTIAGTPAAEDMVVFRIYRDPTHAADTLAVAARLLAVKIYVSLTTTDEA